MLSSNYKSSNRNVTGAIVEDIYNFFTHNDLIYKIQSVTKLYHFIFKNKSSCYKFVTFL